jgi:hypothetical protein
MTTIILTLLLLPPVGDFANRDTQEAATTITVAATQGVELRDSAAGNASSMSSSSQGTNSSAPDRTSTAPTVQSAGLELPEQPSNGKTATGRALSANASLSSAKELPVDGLFRSAGARSLASESSSRGMFIVAATPAEPVVTHRLFDRTNRIGFAIHAAIRAADAAQTCVALRNGAREAWLPMKGCAGIAAYSLSMVPAQIGTSYLLHRRGYHKMERLMPYLWAAPSAAGIAVSMRAW